MAKKQAVPRPQRKSDYTIAFGTRQAAKGWSDLLATQRNAMVKVWDRFAEAPLTDDGKTMYQLSGRLATVLREGVTYEQWQVKPTPKGSARIWYYVKDKTVILEVVSPHHPNQTK